MRHSSSLTEQTRPGADLHVPRKRRGGLRVLHLSLGLPLALLVVLACNDKSSTAPSGQTLPDENAMPDFHLEDVNPASARAGSMVSPRDYLSGISAWYFGSAT